MPKSDRTFSDVDVIRIFKKHLKPKERKEVLLVLCEKEEEEEEEEPEEEPEDPWEEILKLLYILRDAIRQINVIIKPLAVFISKIPYLKRILIVMDFVELILETTLYIIDIVESFLKSNS